MHINAIMWDGLALKFLKWTEKRRLAKGGRASAAFKKGLGEDREEGDDIEKPRAGIDNRITGQIALSKKHAGPYDCVRSIRSDDLRNQDDLNRAKLWFPLLINVATAVARLEWKKSLARKRW